MPLEEAQLKKVKVGGNYFSWDKSSSTLTYLGTPECTDPAPYSAESILALVELTYTGSHAYTFRDEKMPSKLDALLEALGRQSTPSEVAQRASAATKRAADQNGDNEEGAGRASKKAQQGTPIAGVSFTGRPTTRGALRLGHISPALGASDHTGISVRVLGMGATSEVFAECCCEMCVFGAAVKKSPKSSST